MIQWEEYECGRGRESARPFQHYLAGLKWAINDDDPFFGAVRWHLRDKMRIAKW